MPPKPFFTILVLVAPVVLWCLEAKLSLLSCISTFGDPSSSSYGCSFTWIKLILQTQPSDYQLISKALLQACHLYLLSKNGWWQSQSRYIDHLDTLSVQDKLKDSVCLESSCRTWNRLLLGCHPGHLSFFATCFLASDTLFTRDNLQRWYIECDVMLAVDMLVLFQVIF